MTRAASIAFVLAAMLVLAGSAGGTSARRPARISGMSHTHPSGANTSFVCAKVRKTTTQRARLNVSGPGTIVPNEVYSATVKGKGTKVVSFEIASPGRYTFKLTIAGKVSSKSYMVPPPPNPANGPFACPE